MKEFVTDSNIIENIFNKVVRSNSELNSNLILNLLPKVIVNMETEYKLLLGSTKKELVIKIIIKLLESTNCSQEEIEKIKLLLPDLIDGLVSTFNSTSKLFRKNKKCCFPVKRKK